MKVTITLPKISPGLVSNLLGLLGLIAIVVAVGGMAGVWWAVLTAGVFAVALAYIAGLNDAPAKSAPAGRSSARPTVLSEAAKAS